MNEIAVVKPDHLGDMVLSVPAIRAILHRFRGVTLLAAPSNRFLADHFFPTADFEPLAMAYLQKTGGGESSDDLVLRLQRYAVVVFLREDHVMQDVSKRCDGLTFIQRGSFDRHETLTQWDNVSRFAGPYSRQSFFPECPKSWPTSLRSVGLCISAGFHTNKWPLTLWEALGKKLMRDFCVDLHVIGGPSERDELTYLGRVLGLPAERRIEGSRDLADFLARLDACDVVIGTDSGTLHIAATRVPVLGLYTSSPWRRFAPYGEGHRLLTAEVACSPCVQYMSTVYNACLTRECAMLIEPSMVVEALAMRFGEEDSVKIGEARVVRDPARSVCEVSASTRSPSATRVA